MVTKNQIKLINSLNNKKQRNENQLFVAEGYKVISEFLKSAYELVWLFSTSAETFPNAELITPEELKKISFLTTPNTCLAVFKIPEKTHPKTEGLILALDTINDPGNLGTIIRLCDWFGIDQLICSLDTVDVYNPKVIMATMGSLARVSIAYTDLPTYLKTTKLPIYGTFLNGANIYKSDLSRNGIIVMGNEANGISAVVEKTVTHKITIPQFGNLLQTESLNVATATAIVLSEFCRR